MAKQSQFHQTISNILQILEHLAEHYLAVFPDRIPHYFFHSSNEKEYILDTD